MLLKEKSSTLIRPLTSAEFTLVIAPIFAALNDGHVQIGSSMDAVPVISFPLIPAVYGSKLIVQQGIPEMPLGSEILQVDNISADLIVETVLSITGGQTRALRQSRASANIYFTLAMLLGAGTFKTYSIKARLPTGRIVTKHLRSHFSTSKTIQPYKPPSYTYRTIDRGRAALLTYNRCEDVDRFTKFLDVLFRNISENPVRALIIDLRKNLGGDSRVSDILLSRIAHAPFKQYGGTVERSSAVLKRFYGYEQYVALYGLGAWTAPEGRIIVTYSGDGDLVYPERNKPRFDGPVYMLTGPGTFSSGMTCASAAKAYGLATLVGEETGEPINSTGEVFYAEAPRSGTFGLFPTKLFLGPRHAPDRSGVVPDVEIPTTLADIASKRDPVVTWILGQINKE